MSVLKYYLAMSNRYEVDQPGYYYITARNTEGNLIPKGKVSNMIYVPYPTKLNEESITIENSFTTGDGSAEAPAAIFLDNEHKVQLEVSVANPEEDTLDFSWTEQNELIEDAKTATFEVAADTAEEAQLLDEIVNVKVFTKRNNAHTEFEKDEQGNVIDTSMYKFFRVTDKPHKFDFRLEPTGDERRLTPGIRVREEYSEDHITLPTIAVEFSEENIADANAVEKTFNFLTDTIYYRWRKAQLREDTSLDNYFENDVAASLTDGDEFQVLTIEGNKVPTIEFTPAEENTPMIYYCELINVVNGENARAEGEALADFVARVGNQIARTEYIEVQY